MTALTQEKLNSIVDAVANNSTEILGISAGMASGALEWASKNKTASAKEYEMFGRAMADQASSLAYELMNLGNGGGTPNQRIFFKEASQAMASDMERLRAGGAQAYARYGENIAAAARASKFAKGFGIAGAFIDGGTLAAATRKAEQTGNWVPVAGAIGGMLSAAAVGSQIVSKMGAPAVALTLIRVLHPIGAVVVIGLLLAASGFLASKAGELAGIIVGNLLLGQDPRPDMTAFFIELGRTIGMIDPLILDLNGDGIHTTGVDQSSAHFDFSGEGSRTHTGWITTGDGFLVLDRNNNGAIDTGAELFSNFTKLANGMLAANGFDALREYDSNKDGVIDRHDAIWSSLKIWHDGNSDGMTQQGELLTLDQSGIVEIRLSKDGTIRTLENGNMVRGKGSFVQIVDGKHTEREMLEVWFGQDTLHQKFDTAIALRDDVTALPDINGAGNVRDLWQAASMETAEGSGCRLVPAADRSRFIRLSKPFDGVRNKQRDARRMSRRTARARHNLESNFACFAKSDSRCARGLYAKCIIQMLLRR
ncbi:hypothetical protein [Paraburkholderia bonniea]|uniref:hypothetical protein n=1 Tax=Paraburkholderia bonniea TaxID=2152891 RepID=UPI0012922013|nr:hypothetical protein [Paraburkholderia bonniea]